MLKKSFRFLCLVALLTSLSLMTGQALAATQLKITVVNSAGHAIQAIQADKSFSISVTGLPSSHKNDIVVMTESAGFWQSYQAYQGDTLTISAVTLPAGEYVFVVYLNNDVIHPAAKSAILTVTPIIEVVPPATPPPFHPTPEPPPVPTH